MRRPGLRGWLAHDLTHRGPTAWALSAILFGFYILLYFTDRLEPAARALHLPSKWSLYGLLYTLAVTIGGVLVIRRWRHDRYQVVRTLVVMLVQIALAFALPHLLAAFEYPELYLSYLWPLKIEYFYPSVILKTPLPFILYSFLGSLVMVPLLAIFFGKRWYCSWVCGCGGLANTAGEPFRHLSSKTTLAWRVEKITVHLTLVVAVVVTTLVILSALLGDAPPRLSAAASHGRAAYGLVVSMLLSGVIGVGLYPIGGTRVWCRFFCPMAALLGLVQKLGRFRVRVKPDMCISCGLCSKYCEMGIDVRAYAQSNRSFTRASCVGCGMCAHVCPRGVLALEARWPRDPQERAVGHDGDGRNDGDGLVQIRLGPRPPR